MSKNINLMNTIKNYFLLCLAFFVVQINVGAQDLNMLEIVEEDLPSGDVAIYAKNTGYCPLTATLDFPVLKNMNVDVKLPYECVIPAQAEKHLILKVSEKKNIKSGSYEYRYSLGYVMGDVINGGHDDDFVYQLPFKHGHSHLVGQGYNGRFSHSRMNCLDFNMDEKTEVCAARAGTVIQIKEDSNVGCTSSRCKSKANYVVVYHEDGSLARYIHLKLNGSKVKLGQKVKAGDVIGYSGNTGWSSGPHLHFEVNKPGKNNITYTVPTKFKVDEGRVTYLKEGETYKACHN